MSARPAWKGHLKLSLVTCGVELLNATTQSEKVSFRVLNRETGHTVTRQYLDSVTGKPVEDSQQIKGFEVEDDQFLLFEETEIEAVQIESSHTLSLETFINKADIQQIYLDTPFYLVPSDEVSAEAFAVIRDALAERQMAGLARIVLYRRERPAVIEPLGKGLLLTTLRYDNTVRQPETAFKDIGEVKTDSEMIDLATHIIYKKRGKFDPAKFEDRYEKALLALIEAKKSGHEPPPAAKAERSPNVINLFDALKKSLASEGAEAEPAVKKPAANTRVKHAPKGPAKKPAKRARR